MTRIEKIKEAAQRYTEKDLPEPRPDKQFQDFRERRAQQSNQLRYWARVGHELPKLRKIFSKSQALISLE